MALAQGVGAAIEEALSAAGVRGFIHARDLDSAAEVGVDPDVPVVLASVFKIPVAVELARRFDERSLDPTQRVCIAADAHTPGGTGVSALCDDVELSLRDVAQLMITVSDNTATDVVIERLGIEAINVTMRRLGLVDTVLELDCRGLLARLLDDLRLSDDERERMAVDEDGVLDCIGPERWQACRDIQPLTTNRSTPREVTRLLERIWTDQAASPEGCAFVRRLLGQQVWRDRLRSGFGPGVRIGGKTGTLPFIRNEAGVVEYPDGGRYAVAVFTLADAPALLNPEADRVIGTVARLAVDHLRVAPRG